MEEYALITGASSGIGLEIARELARRKIPCILVARRADRLKKLKSDLEKQFGIRVLVIQADLSRAGAGKALYQAVKKQKLKIRYLVNNAGFGMNGKFSEHKYPEIESMLKLNILTLTELTHLFLQEMLADKNGYILQISSIGAFQPAPYYSAYGATKAYVLSFSEALDFELAGTGVSITTIFPGGTDTEFAEVAGHELPWLARKSMMTAARVARISVDAMMNRKRSVTTGPMNKMTGLMVKLIPRRLATFFAGRLMKP